MPRTDHPKLDKIKELLENGEVTQCEVMALIPCSHNYVVQSFKRLGAKLVDKKRGLCYLWTLKSLNLPEKSV